MKSQSFGSRPLRALRSQSARPIAILGSDVGVIVDFNNAHASNRDAHTCYVINLWDKERLSGI